MSEKLKKYYKLRAEQSTKWANFFDSGEPFTLEKRAEKKEDDQLLEKLAKEATEEWLKEQEQK